MKKRSVIIGLLATVGIFAVFFLFTVIGLFVAQGGNTFKFGDKIGVVEITGVITDSRYINEKIIEYGERDDIKAIILRIDSPGGGVGPSQEIYKEVKRVKEKKKVVVSMGSVAASGGYYIAAAGERIFANPGTLTGSIGVVMEFANIEGLLSKIGLTGYVVKSGEYKDIGSPVRKMTDKEKRLLQSVIDNVHEQFVQAVSEGRSIELSRVKNIADGRIFTGDQAKKLGLVDELGSLTDAIDAAAKMAGIKGKPIVIYPQKRGMSLWDIMFSEDALSQIVRMLKSSYELSTISYR
ncbi:MAG: signal peptide peptidase SppA [Deltaproteobacteria bacterium]|nr:signal peptide peptidase SppA [Deltaproteobacteria bacterium]